MAFPWMAAATIFSSLLGLLGNKQQGAAPGYQLPTRQTTTNTQPVGYQSPMLGLADPAMFESLLRNLGAYSNWGGKSIGGPFIGEILKLMQEKTWPTLLKQYGSDTTTKPNAGGPMRI